MADFMPSRTALWLSFGLSALVVLFLVADAAVSIFAPHLLADAQAEVGFPSDLSPILGGIMLLCALLFAIPRTATIGAILITAFAGGAICTHLRVGEIGSPPQFISFALAALAWLSLWLRDANVRGALGFAVHLSLRQAVVGERKGQCPSEEMRVETSYGVALLLDGTPESKDPRSKASLPAIGKRKPMPSRTPGAAIRALTDPQVPDPSD